MKTALITGASSGIGETFARELASQKIDLVIVARSQEKLEDLAQQLREEFVIKVEVIVEDLTKTGATQRVFEKTSAKGLTIDLLINNAGFGDYGTFDERNLEKQVNMIQLNITALVELTHLFLPGMKERRNGAIINVASIAAYVSIPYLSVYSATKAFVLSFSEALWAENKNTGVHVLVLCPGPTESKFFEAAEFPASAASQNSNPASATDVVKEALNGLAKKQSVVVAGGLANNFIVNVPRFLPREFLVSSLEKNFKSI